MITGGGAMHLNDSFGKRQDVLEIIFNHHEQACAIGAEGYSRTTGKLGVVNVTTGPGGLNALTGVMGQWTDSIPVLYLSGQVKFETTSASCPNVPLRQLGDQEVDIISVVKPLTKYAMSLQRAQDVKKVLQEAIYLATHGRPGPVWIDIPINIQGALIDEATLDVYVPPKVDKCAEQKYFLESITKVEYLLSQAQRPLIIAGHGIRLANALAAFKTLLDTYALPVVTTFNGFDLLPSDHPQFIGRIGTVGNRSGNFALQNADFVLSLGSRNNIRQISYNWSNFARSAKKIVVDIDAAELNKPTITPDVAIQADVNLFLQALNARSIPAVLPAWSEWLSWCLERKSRFLVILDEYKQVKDGVQPYWFMQVLTETMQEGAICIAGNGSACVTLFQAGVVKNHQRMFWNSGCASMGYDLPAAIGAAFGNKGKDVICLAGDGSLQMNIQELATMAHHCLPIKLFYLNNDGYVSIKQTQDNFFAGRRIGVDGKTGVGFPDIIKLAQAYGLPTYKIENQESLSNSISHVLQTPGPIVCEVKLISDYIFSPKLSSEKKPDGTLISKPLEDMFPFLDRKEFLSNMIVEPLEESMI